MQEHEMWLDYAENDLKMAKISLKEDAVISSAFFLTQQCAEKALKGFLIFHDRPAKKIHDLVSLLKNCESLDSSFEVLRNQVIGLNPFVTQYRYPDACLPFPDKTTLEISIKESDDILEFVKQRLPRRL
jgi:HEPN domain-containing protein